MTQQQLVFMKLYSFHITKILHDDSRFKNTFLWGHAFNYVIMIPLLITWVYTISYNNEKQPHCSGYVILAHIFNCLFHLYATWEITKFKVKCFCLWKKHMHLKIKQIILKTETLRPMLFCLAEGKACYLLYIISLLYILLLNILL